MHGVTTHALHRSATGVKTAVCHRRSAERFIVTRHRHLMLLRFDRAEVLLMRESRFLRGRSRHHTTGTAVVAGAAAKVIDDSVVVHIGDVYTTEAIDRTVVVKATVAPIAARITDTGVAVAIIDAAIKADVVAPVTRVEQVSVTRPTPVTGRPQCADERRYNPTRQAPSNNRRHHRTSSPVSRYSPHPAAAVVRKRE